jgi:integrase
VFPRRPGVEDHPIHDSSLNDLYSKRGLQGRHTIHGWRSTFTTILNDQDHTRYRITDMMLGHKVIGSSEAAAHYDHASYAAARREMACVWADQLMVGAPSALALVGMAKPASNVVQLRDAA